MSLIILAGPPCSGKTTYLDKFDDYEVVSSDDEIEQLNRDKYIQNELNVLSVENSLNKIKELKEKGINKIIYDSTNLTILRRKNLLEKLTSTNIKIINFISDFNSIYLNWEKRGKDLKIEMLFYLFIIFQKAKSLEGFNSISDKINIQKNDFKYLKSFLEGKSFEKEKILEENKDLKVLYEFWKKGKKDFFEEYKNKLTYLDEMNLEDKLALFYSDIKYFHSDFITTIDITYKVDYGDFLEGFICNILNFKIEGMKLSKKRTLVSFNRLIKIF